MPLPTPGKPEKSEVPVEIIPAETKQPQPAHEVELDGAGQIVPPKPAEHSVSAEDFRKMQARYEYQARQFERSQRELQEQIQSLRSVPQPVIHTEKPAENDVYGLNKDELNQLGQNDWTKPVQMMSEKIAAKIASEKIKEFFEEREKKQAEQLRQQTSMSTLEREKQWVIEQEPSLNDETSEQFRGFYATYNRLIQEDPTLLQNPRAPRLVSREWKAEAKVPETAAGVQPVDPEKERLKRVAGGVAPQGRPVSNPKTIRLTQDEVDFCQNKGISPAVYASMKDANFKEGVTA
jgi:hypothetical protein